MPQTARCLSLFAVTMWLFAAAPAFAADVWRLQAVAATTAGREIRLGDFLRPISSPAGTNRDAVWRSMSSAVVAVHCDDVYRTGLSSRRLIEIVSARLPGASSVVIAGPEEIWVDRAAPAPAAEPLQTTAAVVQTAATTPATEPLGPVDDELGKRISRMVIVALESEAGLPEGFDLSADSVRLTPDTSAATVLRIEQLSIEGSWPSWTEAGASSQRSVRFIATGRGADRAGTARLTLQPQPAVWVLTGAVRRGESVHPDQLTARPQPAGRVVLGAISDPSQARGMEATRNLRPGEPITDDLLTPIRWVRRGEMVSIRVVAGGVLVTTDGKAIGEGGEDEMIEVETLQPKRRLLARVVGPQVVEAIAHGVRTR